MSAGIQTDEGVRQRFESDTAHHAMTVVLDQGLYRHLRFRASESSFYWFDIVTWPGSLAINGDMGTYTFSRTDDMFEFFGAGRINPDYWSEKLTSQPPSGIRLFAPEVLAGVVESQFEMWRQELSEDDAGRLLKALRDDLLHPEADTRGAMEALGIFQWQALTGKVYRFMDAWEYDLTEYGVQFLWCLYAITYAIRCYREQAKGRQS